MKVYGYGKKNRSKLLELSEVTFEIKVTELKNIISFFQHVESMHERWGEDFDHKHYKDYLETIPDGVENVSTDYPDIIIFPDVSSTSSNGDA